MLSSSASLARMLLGNAQKKAAHARSDQRMSNCFRGYILSRGDSVIGEDRFCRQWTGWLPTRALSGKLRPISLPVFGADSASSRGLYTSHRLYTSIESIERIGPLVSLTADYMVVFLRAVLCVLDRRARVYRLGPEPLPSFNCQPDTVRSRDKHGRDASNETGSPGRVVAHASAAVPRPRKRALCAALDAPPCPERLLGHGGDAPRVPQLPCYFQR